MKKKLAIMAAFAAPAVAAFADGTSGSDVFTAVQGDITTYSGLGWTALAALLAFTLGAKIVKKFAGKAT